MPGIVSDYYIGKHSDCIYDYKAAKLRIEKDHSEYFSLIFSQQLGYFLVFEI